jgi:hypothetical protein
MIVSIMQPYFFPYMGYFQLMAASDVFVGHDNVQYIKGGWINRNRALDASGNAAWYTLPVAAADHTRHICEREYILSSGAVGGLLRRFEAAYCKAANFQTTFSLVDKILRCPEPNVSLFNMRLLRLIAARLGLRKRFVLASELPDLEGFVGEARVIAICERLGATRYINPVGGQTLYNTAHFRARGLLLGFLEPHIAARQGPIPYLSIIHTLMTESDEAIAALLTHYSIIPGESD